jgi:hypothetical protein
MRTKFVLRMAVAALFGIQFGVFNSRAYHKWSGLGLNAYVGYQTEYFNRWMAHPRPELFTIAVGVVAAVLVAVLYECVVFGLSKLLKIR